jgi:hypothetical protein
VRAEGRAARLRTCCDHVRPGLRAVSSTRHYAGRFAAARSLRSSSAFRRGP